MEDQETIGPAASAAYGFRVHMGDSAGQEPPSGMALPGWLSTNLAVVAVVTTVTWAGVSFTVLGVDVTADRLAGVVAVCLLQALYGYMLFGVPTSVAVAALYPLGRRMPRLWFGIVAAAALMLLAVPILHSDSALTRPHVVVMQLAVQAVIGVVAAWTCPRRDTAGRG